MPMMITGNANQISPMLPGMNNRGVNAATEVRTANVSALLMRREPRIAATTPGAPLLRS